jgi:DNA-binding response OmpR family regulator
VPLARILVVDDEPLVLDMLTEVFTLAGYEVLTASAAADALRLVQGVLLDVIVLDIGMPNMDGVTALQRLKALKPNVPIIMLTGNSDEQVGRTTLRWGAFDYIAKPFETAHLVGVVAAAVVHSRDK